MFPLRERQIAENHDIPLKYTKFQQIMLDSGTFCEIPVKSAFFVALGGLGPKWAPGPMKNHRNYCCFSMPAARHPFSLKIIKNIENEEIP